MECMKSTKEMNFGNILSISSSTRGFTSHKLFHEPKLVLMGMMAILGKNIDF